MRTGIASAIVAAATLSEPVATARYVVIPTAIGSYDRAPCRPSLSEDGRIVAFEAESALDPADRNDTSDIYVFDRPRRTLTLASRAWHGAAGGGASRCPSLSGDGQRVVFESDAPDLMQDDGAGTRDVFYFDRGSARVVRLSQWPDGRTAWSAGAAISADGRVAVFHSRKSESDVPSPLSVFRIDLDTLGTIEDLGEGFGPTVSRDGRTVAYRVMESAGTTSGRVRTDHDVRLVGGTASGTADAAIDGLALSGDGRWITYVSRATNLIPGRRLTGRSHVYLDRVTNSTRYLVTTATEGREANGHSRQPAVDGTATRVVFESTATNLGCGRPGPKCAADLNLVTDIFAWERDTGRVTRVNVVTPTLPWLGASTAPAVSFNGLVSAFFSCQPVTDEDDRGTFDLFMAGS